MYRLFVLSFLVVFTLSLFVYTSVFAQHVGICSVNVSSTLTRLSSDIAALNSYNRWNTSAWIGVGAIISGIGAYILKQRQNTLDEMKMQ